MQYSTEIMIDLPREQVVALIDDPDNLKEWQPGLKSMEHISGEYGKPGAQSKLVYDMNGRTIEMTETILAHDLPERMEMRFQANMVDNHVINRFEAVSDNQTRWVTENTFKLSGWMWFMGLFMRGAFTKQTQEDMERFKAFAEAHAS